MTDGHIAHRNAALVTELQRVGGLLERVLQPSADLENQLVPGAADVYGPGDALREGKRHFCALSLIRAGYDHYLDEGALRGHERGVLALEARPREARLLLQGDVEFLARGVF